MAQLDGMTDQLRNRLWNVLLEQVLSRYGWRDSFITDDSARGFSVWIWGEFLLEPVDSQPQQLSKTKQRIREHFFAWKWHRVYDFFEFLLDRDRAPQLYRNRVDLSALQGAINRALELGGSGYRCAAGRFVPVTSDCELESVTTAIADSPCEAARIHLRRASDLLGPSDEPDFRNSVKESISAVESALKAWAGDPKMTLGGASSELKNRRALHPSLIGAIEKLWGYASGKPGIRHGGLEVAAVSRAEARFVLVVSSAIIHLFQELPLPRG
jgi:hypothetical protein